MTKYELRKTYRAKRKALSLEKVEDLSLAIANKALDLSIWKHSVYSTFMSITKNKEVNTQYLLNILHGKDKNIVVSKSHTSTNEMAHFLLTDDTKLKVSSFGIPEPVSGIEILPEQIDVVFVPLLAYDQSGNRIGYGKGFYDRFLSRCQKNTLKIGLSFFEPEKERIPFDKHDIPLDYCITPKNVHDF